MTVKGFRKQPMQWPACAFFAIKGSQTFSCLFVLAIMALFAYHLKKDNYPIPWQFLSLAVISVLSLFNVLVTTVLFCCRALNPLFVMTVEVILSILWAFCAGALGKGMGGNIVRSCALWKTVQGITVCHLFKSVFSFTLICWFAMVCGALVAAGVRRRQSAHKYEPANPASLQQQNTAYTPHSGIIKTNVPYGQGGTYKGAEDNAPSYG